MELLQLKCRVCGDMKHLYLSNSCNTAFEFMEWSDLTDNVPDLYERIWERSNIAPAVGEKRLVKVKFPFSYRTGDRFDVLFQPALAALNGWETAEEINASAIVTCKFIRTLSRDEYFAWIEVEAVRVLPLGHLATVSPVSEIAPIYTNIQHFGEWTLCSWSGQGDVGEWELFHADSVGMRSVLFSSWAFCYSEINYNEIFIDP